MIRMFSLVAAAAAAMVLASVTVAQPKVAVPGGHWTYDCADELVAYGIATKPTPDCPNGQISRELFAHMVNDAIGNMRKRMATIPTVAQIKEMSEQQSESNDTAAYDQLRKDVSLCYKQASLLSKMSVEFGEELTALSCDTTAFRNEVHELDRLNSEIDIQMANASFRKHQKQNGPEVSSSHWAYDAQRTLGEHGFIYGYKKPVFEICRHTGTKQFAAMIQQSPGLMDNRITALEADVKGLIDAASVNGDYNTTLYAKLVAEHQLLCQDSMILIAMTLEFQKELTEIGTNVEKMNKDAISRHNRLEMVRSMLRRAQPVAK